jgi:hypothetical protein
MEGVS